MTWVEPRMFHVEQTGARRDPADVAADLLATLAAGPPPDVEGAALIALEAMGVPQAVIDRALDGHAS